MEKENLLSEQLLTRQQTAAYLSICLTTLDRLDIPRLKIRRSVRYRMSDIVKWISKQNRQEAKNE